MIEHQHWKGVGNRQDGPEAHLRALLPDVQLRSRYPRTQSEFVIPENSISPIEQPGRMTRSSLQNLFGDRLAELGDQFDRDGILIIPGYLSAPQLESIQAFFERQVRKKVPDPFINQVSFTGSSDDTELRSSLEMGEFMVDPLLLTLAAYYFGRPPVLAFWRGYRLYPHSPMRYRAWDWHNDQKRTEIKAMLLLSDVSSQGQPMEYIKGSHKHTWRQETQADTKYTIREALAHGTGTVTRCIGKAGTVIVFDTNGVHRGVRSLQEARDIVAVNYVPWAVDAALFPLEEFHPSIRQKYHDSFVGDALTREKSSRVLFRDGPAEQIVIGKLRTVRAIHDQCDSRDSDTEQIIGEYDDTPTYDQAKPRFRSNNHHCSFKQFLHDNPLLDLQSDLDLPVRLGDADVARDIQIVSLRDRGMQDVAVDRLRRAFLDLDFGQLSGRRSLTVTELTAFADKLREPLEWLAATPSTRKEDESIDRCAQLASDLKSALSWTDSTDRLRTNLIFIYAIWDHLLSIAVSQSDQLIQRGLGRERVRNWKATAKELLQTYAYVVLYGDQD